jgi:hypothetical protein
MTTEFVAVPATLTAAETIDRLRELEPDAETIYYVYVVDDDGRLVGVLSLRDLIVARPDTLISGVMIAEPVAVGVLADQDEVARVVARYNCSPSRSSTPAAISQDRDRRRRDGRDPADAWRAAPRPRAGLASMTGCRRSDARRRAEPRLPARRSRATAPAAPDQVLPASATA